MKTHPNFIAIVILAAASTAFAASATWELNPTSDAWTVAANWTPQTVPNDPTDVATFDASNITAIAISRTRVVAVAEIVFDPGASAYTISASGILNIFGAGITNNSGVEQNLVVPGFGSSIRFRKSATAGDNTVLVQSGGGSSVDATQIVFRDRSSAGSATFISEGNAQANSGMQFHDSATAANASFYVQASSGNSGLTSFNNDSTAGNATIFCEGGSSSEHNPGQVFFNNNSSAENATIILNSALDANGSVGEVKFNDRTSAANATVIAEGATAPAAGGGYVQFFDSAMAANASFIINGGTNDGSGGTLQFWFASLGGPAQVNLLGNGTLDLTHHDLGSLSIGSLAGEGLVRLGTTNLIVGTNNFTTEFSGNISDNLEPPFASLTKTGAGNFALAGANDYGGGTFVEGRGILFVNNVTGSGTGSGAVQVNSSVLGGNGIISGPVIIGNGVPSAARLMPGRNDRNPGVLTIANLLSFRSDGTYVWLLNSARGIASSLVAKGVTIDSAALFSPAQLQSGTLNVGTVFTVINNNGSAAIAGTFSNLPDGGTITVGNNTFQANYEGGDGNDLTLTIISN